MYLSSKVDDGRASIGLCSDIVCLFAPQPYYGWSFVMYFGVNCFSAEKADKFAEICSHIIIIHSSAILQSDPLYIACCSAGLLFFLVPWIFRSFFIVSLRLSSGNMQKYTHQSWFHFFRVVLSVRSLSAVPAMWLWCTADVLVLRARSADSVQYISLLLYAWLAYPLYFSSFCPDIYKWHL